MTETAVEKSTEIISESSPTSTDAKKKFRAVRQGAVEPISKTLLWLIWFCTAVEFYFADSNLPYDKCVESFILTRLKLKQFSQVHVDTALTKPGTLGSH